MFSIVLVVALSVPSPANEIVVCVHENLIPKIERKRATEALEVLIGLIEEQVNIPTRVEILYSDTRSDLKNTANRLRNGRIHTVAMSALEYNWLRLQGYSVECPRDCQSWRPR